MRFRASNYGSFSRGIPTDMEGYSHTTQAGWVAAPMDWARDDGRAYRLERCKDLAAQTRTAVRESERALAEWRARK